MVQGTVVDVVEKLLKRKTLDDWYLPLPITCQTSLLPSFDAGDVEITVWN